MQERGKKVKKKGARGRGKSRQTLPVKYDPNANYTLSEAAAILRRHPDTVRKLARLGRIKHQFDSAGYLFTGWAIKDYAERRCLVDVNKTEPDN